MAQNLKPNQIATATSTILGRVTAGTGDVEQLTGTQATTLLDLANGSLKGLMSSSDFTKLAGIAAGAQPGTLTAIGVTTANGVSGTSSGGTTPNLTITLGAITPTSVTTDTIISNAGSDLNLSAAGAFAVTIPAKSGTTNTGLQILANSTASAYLDFTTNGSYRGGISYTNANGFGVSSTAGVRLNAATGSTAVLSVNNTTILSASNTGVTVTGNISATNLSGTNTGDQTTITGNAGTATALQTSRNFSISGGGITAAAVGFTGAANVTLSASVDSGHITLARMANLAANSIIGNNTGAGAVPLALSGTQVTAMLDAFTTGAKGLAPASGGGTTNFLRADGTWASPGGIPDGDKGDVLLASSGASFTVQSASQSFTTRSGALGSATADSAGSAMYLAFDTSDQYKHAIKSRHNSVAPASNALDFWLHKGGTDSATANPTHWAATLDTAGFGINGQLSVFNGAVLNASITSDGALTATSAAIPTINHASGVNLQYNGSTKLVTTTAGLTVTGVITASHIDHATGVNLRYANNTKLTTLSNGVDIAGTLSVGTVSATGNINSTSVSGTNSFSTTVYSPTLLAGTNVVVRGGGSEGGQLVLGYGGGAATGISGQTNSTWNIDVTSADALRFFRQGAAGATLTPLMFSESTGDATFSGIITASGVKGANLTIDQPTGSDFRSLYFFTGGAYSADIGLMTDDVTLKYNTALQHTFNIGGTTKVTIDSTTVTTPSTFVSTNANQMLLKNGAASNATAILRNDGTNTYVLLSDVSTAPSATWNTLRPLTINNTTGQLSSANGQLFSGTMLVNSSASIGHSGTPADKLHVRGDATSASSGIIIQNRATTGALAQLTFLTSGVDYSDNRYAAIRASGGISTTLEFLTSNGAAPAVVMSLSPSGTLSTRDVNASRGDGTGVYYFAGGSTRYLYYNGTNYELNGASLNINGMTAATLSGSQNWSNTQNFQSTGTLATGIVAHLNATAVTGASDGAWMAFHRPSTYAIHAGLDTDNAFKIGGWSDGAGTWRMWLDTGGTLEARSMLVATTPNAGTTGGVRIKANAGGGMSILQFINSAASQEYAYIAADGAGMDIASASGTNIQFVIGGTVVGTVNGNGFDSMTTITNFGAGFTLQEVHNGQYLKKTSGTTMTVTLPTSGVSTGHSCILVNRVNGNITLSATNGMYKNGASATATSGTLAYGGKVTIFHEGGGVYTVDGSGLT